MTKETTIFIDTEDMEERYAEGLYMDYLKEQNKTLNDQLDRELIKRARLEDSINKAVKYSENLLRELEKGTKLDEIAIIVTFRDILKGEE